MPSYALASLTKDHHAEELLNQHPEIVSIAPRMKLDENGQVTEEAVIVIGVKSMNPLHSANGQPIISSEESRSLPSSLPVVVDEIGTFSKNNEQVEVIIEFEEEIYAEMNTGRIRPCPGGFSVGHPRVTAGTLGGIVSIDGNFGFILSNNHVLAATNTGAVGDNIFQPGVRDGGSVPGNIIGTLNRWVPIDFNNDNQVDCALAQVTAPWANFVTRNVFQIGTPNNIGVGQVGQEIRKSGRTTQLTFGSIISNNATINVNLGGRTARFVNQLQYTRMTAGGDSGSFIFDRNSLTVVGLHFAGGGSYSYGNKIDIVLQSLSRAFTTFSFSGEKTSFDKVNISLF